MKIVVQRVAKASVSVDGKVVAKIDEGLLLLVCAMHTDTPAAITRLAGKTARLRIFRDDKNRMNRSLLDVGGAALVVSQFTLAADTTRGNRPGLSAAATPEAGREFYRQFATDLAGLGIAVQTGVFGADMAVSLINDGPVTILLDG